MRILADENVAMDIVIALRKDGHDVFYAAADMPSAPDDQIIDFAIRTGRMLLTNDVACASRASVMREMRTVGVMLLRLGVLPAMIMASIAAETLKRQADMVGKFVIVGPGGVRSKEL